MVTLVAAVGYTLKLTKSYNVVLNPELLRLDIIFRCKEENGIMRLTPANSMLILAYALGLKLILFTKFLHRSKAGCN